MAEYVQLVKELQPALFEKYFHLSNAAGLERPTVVACALRIQRLWRAHRDRKYLKFLRRNATHIQRAWRGHRGRQRAAAAREAQRVERARSFYDAMATAIQKVWRGHLSRGSKVDFARRKDYFNTVAANASELRANAEQYNAQLREYQAQRTVTQHARQFAKLTQSMHHMLSTAARPGFFRSPFGAEYQPTAMGLPIEDHLKQAFAVRRDEEKRAKAAQRKQQRAGMAATAAAAPGTAPAKGAAATAAAATAAGKKAALSQSQRSSARSGAGTGGGVGAPLVPAAAWKAAPGAKGAGAPIPAPEPVGTAEADFDKEMDADADRDPNSAPATAAAAASVPATAASTAAAPAGAAAAGSSSAAATGKKVPLSMRKRTLPPAIDFCTDPTKYKPIKEIDPIGEIREAEGGVASESTDPAATIEALRALPLPGSSNPAAVVSGWHTTALLVNGGGTGPIAAQTAALAATQNGGAGLVGGSGAAASAAFFASAPPIVEHVPLPHNAETRQRLIAIANPYQPAVGSRAAAIKAAQSLYRSGGGVDSGREQREWEQKNPHLATRPAFVVNEKPVRQTLAAMKVSGLGSTGAAPGASPVAAAASIGGGASPAANRTAKARTHVRANASPKAATAKPGLFPAVVPAASSQTGILL